MEVTGDISEMSHYTKATQIDMGRPRLRFQLAHTTYAQEQAALIADPSSSMQYLN